MSETRSIYNYEREGYRNYLQSETWKRKQTAVLRRCGWECEARLEGCTGKATQVHHLNYERVGNEPLWDLRGVCRACHSRLHDLAEGKKVGFLP